MKLEHEGKTYEFDWYLQGGELAFIESIRLEGGDWLDRRQAQRGEGETCSAKGAHRVVRRMERRWQLTVRGRV